MTATKGLEGVVASTSSISSIIGGVLTYRGYHIDDLANYASYEEVVYLLWHGKLPTKQQLNGLRQTLSDNASLPEPVLQGLQLYAKPEANSMAALRTAISHLALHDAESDDLSEQASLRIAERLQAQLPTIIAAFARIRASKQPVAPKAGASIAENFLYMLTGEEPDRIAIDALDKALVLHADHELNASTFAARVTVATLSDMYSGITSAVGTLKGPLHGGANEAVMAMLEEIGSSNNVEAYITQKLDNREVIMGFGHRVYKNGDPRAKHLQKMSLELGKLTNNMKWYDMSIQIEELVTRLKGLKPNVDFYSASVYTALQIPRDLFTPIFAISRLSGWTAHIMEQYANNRIIRPRAEYVGQTNQKYIELDRRT